jgi:hypothetical protein
MGILLVGQYVWMWVAWAIEWFAPSVIRAWWQYILHSFIRSEIEQAYQWDRIQDDILLQPKSNWIHRQMASKYTSLFVSTPTCYEWGNSIRLPDLFFEGLPAGSELQGVYCDDIIWDPYRRHIVCHYWILAWVHQEIQLHTTTGYSSERADQIEVNENMLHRIQSLPGSGLQPAIVNQIRSRIQSTNHAYLIAVRQTMSIHYNHAYLIDSCEHSLAT